MARRVQKTPEKPVQKKKSRVAGGDTEKQQKLRYEITTIATIAMGLIVAIFFIPNSSGMFGAWFSSTLVWLLGAVAAYLIPVTIVGLGINFIIHKQAANCGYKYFLGILLLWLVSIICAYHWEGGGGILGELIANPLKQVAGIGGGILLVALLLVLIVLIFEVSVTRCFAAIGKAIKYLWTSLMGLFFGDADIENDENLTPREREIREIEKSIAEYERKHKKIDIDLDDKKKTVAKKIIEEIPPMDEPVEPEPKPVELEDEPIDSDLADILPIIPDKPIEQIVHEEMSVSTDRHVNYQLPPISLLKKQKDINPEKQAKELAATAKKLIDTLADFGVEAKIIDYSMGPSVTRYELQPGPGVKISKISGLSDDIALNLAAMGVRIEAPIPGKAAIGIEIPNKNSAPVNIREIITHPDFATFPSKLAFALGKDIAGTPIVADIARMPHLLIAGSTGAGKSVCINALITSLLYKALPDEVKLIMIDPKMVELGGYNGIPHLLIPVVTNPQKAAGALQWAVKEMTDRYKMFADNGVRDLKGYNAYADAEDLQRMPQIVIIIDELADLMMVAPNDVEDSICRLAQMARAAGMHLVIATQRPSVDVITGIIKANIPSRISFAVSSQIDSRTILDSTGAEKLLGRGDMLYAPIGSNKPIRLQGPFVSDAEVEAVVDFVKNQTGEQEYNPEIVEVVENFEIGSAGAPDPDAGGKADELLPQAIEMAIETGQASVAMYQRRLKVGYQRAARLIDQMETRGIIGPFDGTKPRQVLINRAQFHEMMTNADENITR